VRNPKTWQAGRPPSHGEGAAGHGWAQAGLQRGVGRARARSARFSEALLPSTRLLLAHKGSAPAQLRPTGARPRARAIAAPSACACGCAQVARTEHVLGACGSDDDLRAHGRGADLHAAVAVLSQLAREQLVQLRVKDAVRHKLKQPALALLAHNAHASVPCASWRWAWPPWLRTKQEAGVEEVCLLRERSNQIVLHANRMSRASPVRAAAHQPADRADSLRKNARPLGRRAVDERSPRMVLGAGVSSSRCLSSKENGKSVCHSVLPVIELGEHTRKDGPRAFLLRERSNARGGGRTPRNRSPSDL